MQLERVGDHRFVARSHDGAGEVVFGGQLMAQTIMAAAQCAPGKQVLSLQSAFARGASTQSPLELDVEVLHAGRTTATVAVSAAQGPRLCCRSLVMLHEPDHDVIRHAATAPATSGPPDTADGASWWQYHVEDGADIRDPDAVGPAELRVWTRFPEAPPDDAAANQALLTWATDGFLIGTAMRPHPGYGQALAHRSISTTVLTHTLSFHEPLDAASWLLMDLRSTYAGRGRAQGHDDVFDEAGRHVASFSQVAMIRAFAAERAPAAGEVAKYRTE